jgi:hypothetical protein
MYPSKTGVFMNIKIAIAAAAIVAVSSPAFAVFYVVQDNASKTCNIVEQAPAGSNMQVLGGNNKSYQTRAEAETAMRGESNCGTTGSNPRPSTPAPSSPAPAPR